MTQTLSPEAIDAKLKDLKYLGYTSIEGFLDEVQVQKFNNLTNKLATEYKGSFYPGYSEKRANDEQIFNLQSKELEYLSVLDDPRLESLLMPTLNDEFYPTIEEGQPNYILGEYIVRTSGDFLKLHIDSWIPATGDMTWMVQVAIVLGDRGEEEGCTILVPGSHLSGKYSDRDYENVTKVPAKAGDLLLWDSRLWHGALPAKSNKKIWVLIATLQRWWVKQRFDIPHSLSPEMFDRLSAKQKVLLGYASMPYASELKGVNTKGGYDRVQTWDDFESIKAAG